METAGHTQVINSPCHKHPLAMMNLLVNQRRRIVHLTAKPGSLREGHFSLAKLIATMECGCIHELEFGSMSTMQLYTSRFGFLDPFREGGGVGKGNG